ncbi:unnamed protein product [Cochlearia groenlandica]
MGQKEVVRRRKRRTQNSIGDGSGSKIPSNSCAREDNTPSLPLRKFSYGHEPQKKKVNTFSIREFAIATGLDCSEINVEEEIVVTNKTKALAKHLFGQETPPTPKWIEDTLNGAPYKDRDTRMRLALLLISDRVLCRTSAEDEPNEWTNPDNDTFGGNFGEIPNQLPVANNGLVVPDSIRTTSDDLGENEPLI